MAYDQNGNRFIIGRDAAERLNGRNGYTPCPFDSEQELDAHWVAVQNLCFKMDWDNGAALMPGGTKEGYAWVWPTDPGGVV